MIQPGRKSRTKLAADKHVVVHVPNRSLAGASPVKHIIRLAVAVKIRGRNERPAAGQGRAKEAADKRAPGEIPDCRLLRTGVEQRVVEVAVTIEIRDIDHVPASRKSRAKDATLKHAVVHVPNRCSVRARVVEHEIWFGVVGEVCVWVTARNSACEAEFADARGP